MKNFCNEILQIKAQHPALGYKSIAKLVGCSANTVKYHLKPGNRVITYQRSKQYRKINPLCAKLGHFRELREKKKNFDKILNQRRTRAKSFFTTKDLLRKFGTSPRCYLSGAPIDLDAVDTYEFDHVIPVAKGGDNSLENLGLCLRDINRAKQDKSVADFLSLCRAVLTYADANKLG